MVGPAGAAPRAASSVDVDGDSTVARQHLLAVALLRVRWVAVPLCLLLIILFPSGSIVLALVLPLILGLGNACLARLLQAGSLPLSRRVLLVRRLGIVLEWGVALGLVGVYARNPNSHAPAVLLLLILLAGIAAGLPGLLIAALAASIATVGMVAAQRYLLDVLEASTARDVLVSWMVVIALGALAGGGMVWVIAEYGRVPVQRLPHAAAIDRATCGLSPRELVLLPWLAHAELTYKEIGTALCISPKTVKAHVQHIGPKLGVSGDRWVVVDAARQQGFLPPPGEPLLQQPVPSGRTDDNPPGPEIDVLLGFAPCSQDPRERRRR